MICRHCSKPVTDPYRKGLCWKCAGTPEISKQYPSLSKFNPRKQKGDFYLTNPSTSDCPTMALPGSEEKILVLMRRVENKQKLFHPDDMPMDLEYERIRYRRWEAFASAMAS